MTAHDWLDTVRELLGGQGITLVLVVGTRWQRDDRQVTARVRDLREVEFEASDGEAAEALLAVLDQQQVPVSRVTSSRPRVFPLGWWLPGGWSDGLITEKGTTMSTPGDPHDPSLPPPSGPDPDFIPAPVFVTPAEYRAAYDGMAPEIQARARALVTPPGCEDYLAALDA